jgi:hypothetical protein
MPVHRRQVELQLVSSRQQQRLHHSVQPDQRIDVEVHGNPSAPLMLGQMNRLAGNVEVGRAGFAIPRDRKGQLHVGAGAEIGERLLIGVG